jgi:hypothetical protein
VGDTFRSIRSGVVERRRPEDPGLPTAFRWRRRRPSRGVPSARGDMAVLRMPSERPTLRWDEFVPPY